MYDSYAALVDAVVSKEIDPEEANKYFSRLTGVRNIGYPDFSTMHERHLLAGEDPFRDGLSKVRPAQAKKGQTLPASKCAACVVSGTGTDESSMSVDKVTRFRNMQAVREWMISMVTAGRMEFANADTVVDRTGDVPVFHVARDLGQPPDGT